MKFISKIITVFIAVLMVVTLVPAAFATEVFSDDPPAWTEDGAYTIRSDTRGNYKHRLRCEIEEEWLLLESSYRMLPMSVAHPWYRGGFFDGAAYTYDALPQFETEKVKAIKRIAIVSQGSRVCDVDSNESIGLFRNLDTVEIITGLENLWFNTENPDATPVINSCLSIKQIFYGMTSLKSLDLSGWDMSSIVNMDEAFKGCEALAMIDFSGWDTSSVTSSEDMFEGCTSLQSVALSENFTLQECLPDGLWANSAGELFKPADIPQGVADTYTKAAPAESISISGLQSKYLSLGSEVQLTADVQPSPTSDTVTWASSNDDVVTVDNTGKVTAKGNGTAVIIVTAGNAKATVDIVVEDPLSSISLQEASKEAYLNDGAFVLQVITSPAGLHPSLRWASSNESVASVDGEGKVTPHKVGSATITATTSDGKVASCALTVKNRSSKPNDPVVPSKPTNPNKPPSTNSNKTQPMHRLYNPNSGEHFYTASVQERDILVNAGWSYEDVGWIAPASSRTPVFRLYSGTDHHYTSSAAERDALVASGWSDEGIGWYSDDAKGVPLYRQFNPNVNPAAPTNNSGSHNYTISQSENDFLCNNGWQGEGIGWYGCK